MLFLAIFAGLALAGLVGLQPGRQEEVSVADALDESPPSTAPALE